MVKRVEITRSQTKLPVEKEARASCNSTMTIKVLDTVRTLAPIPAPFVRAAEIARALPLGGSVVLGVKMCGNDAPVSGENSEPYQAVMRYKVGREAFKDRLGDLSGKSLRVPLNAPRGEARRERALDLSVGS